MNLRGGWSLDLTTRDEDGVSWDFGKEERRAKAKELVEKDKPQFIFISPMCSAFSQLQTLNYSKMSPDEVKEKLQEGLEHLKFAMEICEMQSRAGRYFAFEHPWGAKSWQVPAVQKIMNLKNSRVIKTHMCQFEMMAEDPGGTGLVKKPTGIMTNSAELARELERTCSGGHRHISLINGRARACQVYPEMFCEATCRGIQKQLRKDEHELKREEAQKEQGRSMMNRVHVSALNRMIGGVQDGEYKDIHEEDEAEEWVQREDWHGGGEQYVDDITGLPLDAEKVREARSVEVDFFRKKGVYEKMPRSQVQGKKVIKVRWVDVNKGDDKHPDYRSRLVAKEINTGKRPDLFAATPPLESIKYLLSRCARQGWKGGGGDRIMFNVAEAKRELYVELPEEDYDEKEGDMVGKLRLSMYGTRDAAQNWFLEYASALMNIGFRQGLASPCHFFHQERGLMTAVHGDDFITVGPKHELAKMRKELEAHYDLKTQVLGPDPEESKEVRMLNRVIQWTP